MHYLHYSSWALLRFFWAIWAVGLFAVTLGPLLMFSRGFSEQRAGSPFATELETGRADKPSMLAAIGFGVFFALYLGFMFWGEDFAYQDGHAFTDYTAIGIPRPPAIWPGIGRFWPLGYYEYNFIAHLSPTATAYLVFGAIQLVVGFWLLYQAMPHQSPNLLLFMFTVLMLAPAFGVDYAELTYADRNVCFAVCLLVYAVRRYDQKPAASWLLAAIVVSYFALYFKETTAALLGTFALARLALKAKRGGLRAMWQSPLEIGIALSCTYFALQLGAALATGTFEYVQRGSVGALRAAMRYLTGAPLLLAFHVAFGVHVVLTLRKGAKFDPLWDPLALGAVLHLAAVCVTGMAEVYLLGPTELVAALVLVHLASRWWEERASLRPILVWVGGATALATVIFGTYRLIERKNAVWQWQDVASVVVDYYKAPGTQKARLYIPAEDGVVMNFVSFLRYKGLHFKLRGQPAPADAIDVAGSEAFHEDLCVDYEELVCRHDVARAGDLVVRLPQQSWSNRERSSDDVLGLHDAKLEPVFQRTPLELSSPFRPLLAAIYRVSPTMNGNFDGTPLPDDWMGISVSKVVPSVAPPN